MTLPIYPNATVLPGLGYGVKWTPVFFNQSHQAINGANIDIALASQPLHKFDLTYNFLRNTTNGNSTINVEQFVLMGFFLKVGGQLGRFLFDNPDDDLTANSQVGIGDGVTTVFTLGRQYGSGIYTPALSEPIGQVNTFFSAAWNNVVQSSGTYTISTATPGANTITWTGGAPGVGVSVTVTMSYYYLCKFASDSLDFNKSCNNIWDAQVKLLSCRAFA
jgi:hypothetical protein